MTASFVSSKPLAKAILHGIAVPLEAELSFLAASMAGADGWLHFVIKADHQKSGTPPTRALRT